MISFLPSARAPLTMQAPSVPTDEAERLYALCRLGVLDTAPSAGFDRVTRVAARALAVPIALVSLVDETRQWFKSRVGLEATETPREISFCGHAVFAREPLVVNDASLDPRFAGNPLVTEAPYIRAYLGIPLCAPNGQPVGTLCAIDTRPRDFDDADIAVLSDLAAMIEATLHSDQRAGDIQAALEAAVEREDIYKDTFQLAAVGIVHTTLQGKLTRINPHACEMLGYSADELRTLSFIDITHPDDIAQNTQFFLQTLAGEIDNYRMNKRFLRKDGQYMWARLSVALRKSADGKPWHMISVIEDICNQKQSEVDLSFRQATIEQEAMSQTALLRDQGDAMRLCFKRVLDSAQSQRETEQRLTAITNSIPAMIGYWNGELRCEFANNAYRSWFGVSQEEIVGLSMQQLLGDAQFQKNEPFVRAALAGEPQRFGRQLLKADGTPTFVDAQYLPDRDQSGAVIGFYVLVTDVTELRSAQQRLEAINAKLLVDSTTDYLTGLPNRRTFSEKSQAAADGFVKRGATYGLILLDLDDFKLVNDRFGHKIGDDVLRALGRILREQIRGNDDVAARLGGEEFAVLCIGELNEQLLCSLAERIRNQVNLETVASGKGAVRFTSSFGVACCCEGDLTWKDIYARADAALYEAKSLGKNRVAGSATKAVSLPDMRSVRPAPEKVACLGLHGSEKLG